MAARAIKYSKSLEREVNLMKKLIPALIVATVFGLIMFLVTGCAGKKTEPAPSASAAEPQKQETVQITAENLSLDEMIAKYAGKFKQYDFTDDKTGLSMSYNLYLPEGYDESKSYPLVMFIADSSSVGRETTAPLTQGYGGLVWASDAVQKAVPCIVVVPQYNETVLDDHSGYTTTGYVDATKNLIDSLSSKYAVDKTRIYGTGQSMGCMIHLVLSSKYPDLYAACMFVDGQWDVSTLTPLTGQKFIYFAAQGDQRAYQGMSEVKAMFDGQNAAYGSAVLNAKDSREAIDSAAKAVLDEGKNANFFEWQEGSVMPDGQSAGGGMAGEHMYSFDHAYKVTTALSWILSQKK